ncbi:MAG: extracellular solute-binding protein [Candidatus Gastranaerophilales bacterium]|nr:extracellular solute-binding protein [Candidatus Gastranaerophilales bacterium]
MKKLIIIILILLTGLGIFLLSAKKSPENVSDKNAVVFWTLQMGDFSSYMNEIIENFEKQYPSIKIKWVDVPFSEGEKRTLAAILSDNPPDLINLNPDFSAILAQKGALTKIEEKNVKQFNKEIINSLKYNDELYALPWYATSAITIYNEELFRKAGFKTPPKTYKRIGQIASTVKEKTGAYIFMPTITENDTMLKILNKYGINSWENINSEKAVDVFDFYKDLYKKNLIPKETITQTQREALEKYMSGEIVFFQSGANFLNMIKENSPSIYEQTDVSSQITGDLGQNDFSLMNLVIPLKSSKKEDALKFALFLTNEENQLKLAKLTNVIATNRYALRDDFYAEHEDDDLMSKARVISAKQLNHVQPVLRQSKGQKEINLLVNTAVQEILLNNTDTQKVLNNVAKKWKNIVSEK